MPLGEAEEEAAFWWLVHVSQKLLDGFYAPGMNALWVELGALARALIEIRPLLMAHLDALGLGLPLLAPGWFLTLFQRILPEEEMLPAMAALASRKVTPIHLL